MLSMKKEVVLAVVAVIVILACESLCQADMIELLKNGSFENGKTINNGENGFSETFQAGSETSDIQWWSFSSYKIDNIGFAWYNQGSAGGVSAQQGNRWINLLSEGNRTIWQTFPVFGGGTYNVSFYEMNRPGGPVNQVLAVTLSIDSGVLSGTNGSLTVSGSGTSALAGNTGSPTIWTQYTFSFTPSVNATATIKFNTPGGSPYGTELDNVSVIGPSDIPEPGMLTILATGLVSLLAYAWRKQK